MFFNFSMQLMIKKKVDKYHYNLLTTLKITAFIANKCKKNSCKDIVLAFKRNSVRKLILKMSLANNKQLMKTL